MSDIRFNNWKHQSGTGGVTQNSSGNVGIGSTLPSSALDVGGDVQVTGVTTFAGAVDISPASGFPLTIQASNSTIPAIKINNQSSTQRGQILANDHLNIEAYGNDIIFDSNHGGGTAGDILLKSDSTTIVEVPGDKAGVIVTGIVTATSFVGSGANLTGLPVSSEFNFGTTGITTTKNLGINTSTIDNYETVGAANSFRGIYIGDGSLIFNARLDNPNGYYIGTGRNALNAGPITLGSTMTLDGAWVIV